MTKSTNGTPILDDDAITEIEARANATTAGPWAVWDSCSWRRIGTVEPFGDGDVICPSTKTDGHPDLLAKREDLEFIAHARADVPALCATVRALRVSIVAMQNGFDTYAQRVGIEKAKLQSQLEQVTKERDELRQRERKQLTTVIEIRSCDRCELCEDHQ